MRTLRRNGLRSALPLATEGTQERPTSQQPKAFLRTLRILNEDNDITIFSLIGRKDLMAESM